MLNTPIGRLRLIGWIEGVSFLVLLFIAMPLKYAAGKPEAVLVAGWIHGGLFVLYLAALARAAVAGPRSRWWVLTGLAAALLPMGPFVLDAKLRGADREPKPAEAR